VNDDAEPDMIPSVALIGMGGIGKTAIAVEFAYQHRQEFDAVFFIQADTQESIAREFAEIAQTLGLSPGDEAHTRCTVLDWLAQTRRKWLMIVDNVEDVNLLPTMTPATAVHGAVIITSRRHELLSMDLVHCKLEVQAMSEADSTELLLKMLASGHQPVRDQDSVQGIASALGGLPLAIRQAGGMMTQSRTGPREYLARYNSLRPDRSSLPQDIGQGKDYRYPVSSVWSYSFAKLASEPAKLLGVLAHLDPDMIPVALLQPLDTDNAHIETGLEELIQLSFIRAGYHMGQKFVMVHRLVQDAYRRFVDEDMRSRGLVQAAELLSAYCCGRRELDFFTRARAFSLLEDLERFAQDDDDRDALAPLIAQACKRSPYVYAYSSAQKLG